MGHVEDARVEFENGEAFDEHDEVLVSEPKQVKDSKMKNRKQLPINMEDSHYNLDSLIYWCTSLRMLLRATLYLLRALGRRFPDTQFFASVARGRFVSKCGRIC